ncbi:MAG: PTS glucose transporter subunit IIA [Erysipelotrichaceae bacterium]|nr:PTS glucose transporter subunit IIA [Erysipelotrichaceae bacterium]
MGLFDKFLKKEEPISLPELNVGDDAIVAIADGEVIDITTVSDPVFAEQMMGKSTAFKYDKKTVLCSPANGTLSVLFPTGHAFGIITNEGVELLVHCGVDTVNAKGNGFRILNKKQGDPVKAGDPIVEVDVPKLSNTYDMSTMLIITNANDKQLDFIDPQPVTRGQSVIK